MKSIIFSFIIITSLDYLIQSSFLDKIPGKYIKDSSFISMTLKSPKASKILYASTKGHGSDCTISNPCILKTAIKKLKPGYILYLKEGEYNVGEGITINLKGSPNSYIIISSAPGEKAIITSECNKKELKYDEISLFLIEKSSYVIIENLIFKNSKAKELQGIVFYGGGQNHIIIRNNEFISLQTTKNGKKGYEASGILLMGEDSGIDNVIIFKNKLLNNVLGYSEAISIEGNCQHIYVLNNTLKNNSNIGIDFNGNTEACDVENLDQPRFSVAMYNHIEKSIASYNECAGIYVDGAKEIYIYENYVGYSQFGIEIGAEENKDHQNPITNIVVENNKLVGNIITGIRVGGFKKNLLSVTNTKFIKNIISKSKTSIIISKVDNISFEENQISDVTNYFIQMEFSKDYTKNVKFEKNTFSGTGIFLIYGKKLTLKEFLNKYKSNN